MSAAAHLDRLRPLYDPLGRDVADIGCGRGAFALALVAAGARVAGVDPQADALTAARAQPGAEAVTWIEAGAEAQPLGDEAVDLVTFVFSLHHVPADSMGTALAEALRVLRPDGRLHVVEPTVEGEVSDVLRPLEDETEIRRAAEGMVRDVAGHGATLLHEETYLLERVYRDAEAFLDGAVAAEPERRARVGAVRQEVLTAFDRRARPTDGGMLLTQPCRVLHLKRR